MTNPAPTGRPSLYSDELAARICAEIAVGNSLRTICKADDMPCIATIFLWIKDRPGFSEQYARAREAQMDALSEDILEIADDGRNDWVKNQDGVEVYNGDHVQRSKLRVETRKWLMSKLAPKRYGDKMALTGPDNGPLQVNVVQYDDSDPAPQ